MRSLPLLRMVSEKNACLARVSLTRLVADLLLSLSLSFASITVSIGPVAVMSLETGRIVAEGESGGDHELREEKFEADDG